VVEEEVAAKFSTREKGVKFRDFFREIRANTKAGLGSCRTAFLPPGAAVRA